MGVFRGLRNAGLPNEVKAQRYDQREQSTEFQRESIQSFVEHPVGRFVFLGLALVLVVGLVYAMVR